jgi:tetratricopeptide (TPR) repeat protein
MFRPGETQFRAIIFESLRSGRRVRTAEKRCMKYVLLLIALTTAALAGFPQQTKKSANKSKPALAKPTPAKKTTATAAPKKPVPKPKTEPKRDEKTELEKATAIEDAAKRVAALEKFLVDFPTAESRSVAAEALTSARVSVSEAKFDAGDREAAVKFARKAIEEAPVPYPEKLFTDSLAKVPMMLYTHGEASASYEIAAAIEKSAASSAPQLLALANFYLATENGTEGKRLAEAAIKIDERSAPAYQTLGMANRLSFDLEASAAAYEKAAELDPTSSSVKQSLAEMKRALGKPDEAIAIFSSLIEKDPNDVRSQNGRILSLFDAGKRADAEAEFAKALEGNHDNFILLAGASYWYAANNENAKAIDLAGKAISIEPRYIWSHIALARGLSGDGRYTDAEQVLLRAKQYGNFPTLEYEIAAAKFAAGFYREAANELQKSFAIKDGNVTTKLGRRIDRSEKNFIDLLAAERRASILESKAADSADQAEKMKALLEFYSVMSDKTPDEARATEAAAVFAAGSDKMRLHRQIFAANELLERSIALAKVLELSRSAVSSVDDGLNVPSPAAPIMASELYAGRSAAIAADKYLVVPDVPKQTLSTIARGRIEEIAGSALLLQKNNAEAAIRLRRAISILPEKSAWWRTSLWRLGIALEAEGKDKDALDAYVKNYTNSDPDAAKYALIETVYKRVNTSTDGLDALIGANPAKPAEKAPEVTATTEQKTDPATQAKTEVPAETKAEPTPEKKTEAATEKPTEPPSSTSAEKETPKAAASPSPESEVKKSEEKPLETKTEPVPEPSPKAVEIQPKTDDVKPEATDTKPKLEEPKPSPIEEPSPKPIEATEKPSDSKTKETGKTEVIPPPTETETMASKTPETRPTPKPLFEPVVIEIKNSKQPKDSTLAKSEPETPAKPLDQQSGSARPRVVVGKDIVADVKSACTITASQENISLIGGGGSVGVLVGVENGDIKDVKAASSSVKDVEVVAEPEIAGVSGRALFVIRSLTASVGTYHVAFTSPCGNKEVAVRVR